MSKKRYINNFKSSKTDEQINEAVTTFLQAEGFKLQKYGKEEEPMWIKGIGLAAAPQCVKVTTNNSDVQLEAFLTANIVPGVSGKEMNLTGIYAFAIKKALKKKVEKLEGLIK